MEKIDADANFECDICGKEGFIAARNVTEQSYDQRCPYCTKVGAYAHVRSHMNFYAHPTEGPKRIETAAKANERDETNLHGKKIARRTQSNGECDERCRKGAKTKLCTSVSDKKKNNCVCHNTTLKH